MVCDILQTHIPLFLSKQDLDLAVGSATKGGTKDSPSVEIASLENVLRMMEVSTAQINLVGLSFCPDELQQFIEVFSRFDSGSYPHIEFPEQHRSPFPNDHHRSV